MTRTNANDELEKIVRGLRADGLPVTLENVMTRCELPRSTIARWLAERGTGVTDEDWSVRQGAAQEPGYDSHESMGKALLDDAFHFKVGFDSSVSGDATKRKSLAKAALLGLLFPPAAFAYAAPLFEGTLFSIFYLLMTVGVQRIPYLGKLIGMTFVLPLNVIGLFLGIAYAAVHGANGKRTALFLGRSRRRD